MGTRYQIHVQDMDAHFTCGDDQRLLHAMENAGVVYIPVGCKGGGCGVCRVQILEGEYEARKMSRAHISEEDEDAGIYLACRIIPKSDLSLRLVPIPGQEDKEGAQQHPV